MQRSPLAVFILALLVQENLVSASRSNQLTRVLAGRSVAAAELPDPTCKSGVISLKGQGPDPQVCCASYCGECSDYETCGSVRGQDSENACCASKVAEMGCDAGAPANVCLKSCEEGVPPCIMPKGKEFKFPETKRSAGDDCNEAVPDFMRKVSDAIKNSAKDGDGPTGEDQWKMMQKRNFVKSSVVRAKMEKLVGHLPDGFSFKVFDANGDGGVSLDEMQKYFSSALPGGYDATVVGSIHDAFDSNKDGQVSPAELAAGMAGFGGPAPAAFLQAMICVGLSK